MLYLVYLVTIVPYHYQLSSRDCTTFHGSVFKLIDCDHPRQYPHVHMHLVHNSIYMPPVNNVPRGQITQLPELLPTFLFSFSSFSFLTQCLIWRLLINANWGVRLSAVHRIPFASTLSKHGQRTLRHYLLLVQSVRISSQYAVHIIRSLLHRVTKELTSWDLRVAVLLIPLSSFLKLF